MAEDKEYSSNLAEFVDKCIKRWAGDKKKILEPKLRRNFEAVTNADYRTRTWKKGEATDWRSDTWIGFVRIKVWSFYAVFLDTVLKAGKIPFVLVPSKYDEKYMSPAILKERDARLEKMSAKIEGQLDMRHADREYMKKWLSLGYYGMAFSAFDIEDVETTEYRMVLPPELMQAAQQGLIGQDEVMQYARFELSKDAEPVPGHPYVSVWSMVWDMDTDDFHKGAGYAQHEKCSPYDLRIKEGPGYIPENIDRAIKQNMDSRGQDHSNSNDESPGKAALTDRQKTIDCYKFYMRVPVKYAKEFEEALRSGDMDVVSLNLVDDTMETELSGNEIEIMGEMAGGEIIRYIRNETGKRPHKMCVLERNLDETTGTGIADNMEKVQESFNGMLRAFEDNKKLSANVITAVKKMYFNDSNQAKTLFPGLQIDLADSCDDARKAILPIIIPDVGESLMSGIQLLMQLKDDVSMIPTIMQGFTMEKHQPDTAYELQQLTNNAGKYIGQGIRNNDEQFIEPEIQDIYDYNMLYGDDDDCKVNCKVKANGFTSYMNKIQRGAQIQQALAVMLGSEILAPYVEVEPHLEIIYESMDEDPSRFIKSEEKRNKEAQNNMVMQEKARQMALQDLKAQADIEAGKEITVKDAEHGFSMEEQDQKHEHKMAEEGMKKLYEVVGRDTRKNNQQGARQ